MQQYVKQETLCREDVPQLQLQDHEVLCPDEVPQHCHTIHFIVRNLLSQFFVNLPNTINLPNKIRNPPHGFHHVMPCQLTLNDLPFAPHFYHQQDVAESITDPMLRVGLMLNADKSVVLTPSTITSDRGITLTDLQGNIAQKWLEPKKSDVQYHLQQAAKAYHANK